jgi:AAHS family 4-hydroxybenzoate transporter-like MFS transporter
MNAALGYKQAIDDHPVRRIQIRIFVICAFVAFFDGYDTQAIGYVASLLAKTTNTPIASFGIVFSIGLAGAAVGAFVLGPLGDRLGRKWLLILSCALFSVFSLLTVKATSYNWLLSLRFITGLGLGGAVPVSLALVAEYFPTRVRGLAVTAMFSAFPLGGFIGGILASALIESFGWESIFVIGSVIPGALCIAIWLWVPESIHFLISRNKLSQAKTIISAIAPLPLVENVRLETEEVSQAASGSIFKDASLGLR